MSFRKKKYNMMAYNYKSSDPPALPLELGYEHQNTQRLHIDEQQQHLSLPFAEHSQRIPLLAQPVSVIQRAPAAENSSPVVPIAPLCEISPSISSTTNEISNHIKQENTDLDLWIVSETPPSDVRPNISRARRRDRNIRLLDNGHSMRENEEEERTTDRNIMRPYCDRIYYYTIEGPSSPSSQLRQHRDFYFSQHNEQQHMIKPYYNYNYRRSVSVGDSLNAGPSGISERLLEGNNSLESNDNNNITPPVMYQNNYHDGPKSTWAVNTLPEQDCIYPQQNEQQHMIIPYYNYNYRINVSVGDSLNAGPSGISERQLVKNNNLENNDNSDNTPPVMYQNNCNGPSELSHELIVKNPLENVEASQFPAIVNSAPKKRKYRKKISSKGTTFKNTLPKQDSIGPQHNEPRHMNQPCNNYNYGRRESVGDSLNAGPSGISVKQLVKNNDNSDNTPPVVYQNNYDGPGESSHEHIKNPLDNVEASQFPATVNSAQKKKKYRKKISSKGTTSENTLPKQDSICPQHNETRHMNQPCNNYNYGRRESVGDSLNAGPSGISVRQLEENNNLENNDNSDNTPPVMYQNNYDGPGESSHGHNIENPLQNHETSQFLVTVNKTLKKRIYRKRVATWIVKSLANQDEAMQNQEFHCTRCPKKYIKKRSLTAHMRWHKA